MDPIIETVTQTDADLAALLTTEAPAEVAGVVEAPKVEEPAKEGPLGGRFVELAKRERQHQLEMQKFKAESQGFKEFQQAKINAEKDPLAFLNSGGITEDKVEKFYDALTMHLLDGKSPANAKYRELESRIEQMSRDKKESEERSAAQSADSQKAHAERQVADKVREAGDKFELINTFGRHDLVCQEIVRHYKETNEELTIEAAADKIEKLLEAEADKAYQTKKYQAKYKSAPNALKLETKTLTNSASNGTTQPPREMSDDETMAWATRVLQK